MHCAIKKICWQPFLYAATERFLLKSLECLEFVGHVVPSVLVYLTFTLMYGGIITHSFITCKLLHLNPQAVNIVNHLWKALRGVDNIYIYIYIDIDIDIDIDIYINSVVTKCTFYSKSVKFGQRYCIVKYQHQLETEKHIDWLIKVIITVYWQYLVLTWCSYWLFLLLNFFYVVILQMNANQSMGMQMLGDIAARCLTF